MRSTILFSMSALLASTLIFSQSTEKKEPGKQNSRLSPRDLSDMFYKDTLPDMFHPRPETPMPPPPKPNKPKQAPRPHSPDMSTRRVGLKYQIQLCTSDCNTREVDPSYAFSSGDRIRFQFESNIDGYLYVLNKQSSGRDALLFPHPDINGGANQIKRGIHYPVPVKTWYVFKPPAGEEQITVILSREPMKVLPQEVKSEAEGSVSANEVVEELNRSVRSRDLELFS